METEELTAYLSLGSNLGDRKANLCHAVASLVNDYLTNRKMSSYYETEPVGFCEQPWFLNLALEVCTNLSPHELLQRCQQVEQALGRIRSFPDAPRTLDMDILLFGSRMIEDDHLTVPHPRMAARRFVLVPLSEIAPDVVHPVLGKSIQSLLASCPDTSIVRFYSRGDLR